MPRYKLRTLLILLAVVPPVLGLTWLAIAAILSEIRANFFARGIW